MHPWQSGFSVNDYDAGFGGHVYELNDIYTKSLNKAFFVKPKQDFTFSPNSSL